METIGWCLRWNVRGSDELEKKFFKTEEELYQYKSDMECSGLSDAYNFSIARAKMTNSKRAKVDK